MPGLPRTIGQPRGLCAAELHVEPEWIDFFQVRPGRVRIEVAVHNRGGAASPPGELQLEASPVGAFLSWRPLQPLRLPTIAPRQTLTIATEVHRSETPKNSVPITHLRQAASAGGALDRIPGLRRLWAATSGETVRPEPWAKSLPLDPFELLGRRTPHWIGRVRARVPGAAAIRCLARALRVAPNRVNVVPFRLGTRREHYRFELSPLPESWRSRLLVLDASDGRGAFEVTTPLELPARTPMALCVTPPQDARSARLLLRVEAPQQAARETLEFELDPEAPGPGCFLK